MSNKRSGYTLKKGHTGNIINSNIRSLEAAGYPHKQAVAIAMVQTNIKGVKRSQKGKGEHVKFGYAPGGGARAAPKRVTTSSQTPKAPSYGLTGGGSTRAPRAAPRARGRPT